MSLTPESGIRKVSGIDDEPMERIRDFMQGAIYCWCKNNQGQAFAVRDLVGGVNTNWVNTPLQVLYTKHENLGKSPQAAFEDAAKDLGWIVKGMINADSRRNFFLEKSELVNHYRWDGSDIT